MTVDKEMKILVVEDSGITRKMEIKILKELGFNQIVEATDGLEAIQKLEGVEKGVQLIISDWNMPNKNGYDLLVWVRGNKETSQIPFIMATAQGEKKVTAKAEEAGVTNFITKPFSPPELLKVIEETFSGKKEADKPKEIIPRETLSGKPRLTVAHIQITDHLTLGVLKNHIEINKVSPQTFALETKCMPSWNPVQQALEKGEVDAAFILAPIAMDLFSAQVPIKLVLFAHKNGSIAVRGKKEGSRESIQESFKGKTFYIPHILSIHHMLMNMFLREIGLNPGLAGHDGVDVFFEVVPPVKMPEFLSNNPEACGFTVAEPMGTKAIAAGTGKLLYLSGEMWEYHPCCVVVFREEFISSYPDAVQEFTNLLVQAGQFIYKYPEKAAEFGVGFLDPEKKLGLNVPVLRNVLKEPKGIKTDDLFPVVKDLERIQKYMNQEMGIGTMIDLEKFVEPRFAQMACKGMAIGRRSSVVHDVSKMISRIVVRQESEQSFKTKLDKEGKYLIFSLGQEDYGIGISMVKEIIGMMPLISVPKAPAFVKGVINLRDKVIPIIDLRAKLHLPEQEYHERTCIIVLDLGGAVHGFQIGLIVDSVSEVLNIQTQDIEDTPSFGKAVDTSYILALAKIKEQVKVLLNTGQLFKQEEAQALQPMH
jgi:chemotaxis signal transduction protein/ABC-type nitrate/sulfonate/bicarbonate transport system substrate-binding protein/AmiR/NasT family two-component response regulator